MYIYTNEQIKKLDYVMRYLKYLICQACEDVRDVDYEVNGHREVVIISYNNGYKRWVDVTADSLLALTRDVLDKL